MKKNENAARRRSRFRLNPFLRALLPLSVPGLALAAPAGGVVVGGEASISTPDAVTTVIDQASNAAAINWQSFDVGGDEFVVFHQPDTTSVTLNRVVGGDASTILGSISANGRVFLINPAGVLFGAGSRVDVGGLVASTLDISNQDFFSGNYVLAQPQGHEGRVENAGTLGAADGGFVVLAGAEVRNSGLIQARLGQVLLASGAALTLDIEGSGLVAYEITRGTLADAAGVGNVGEILAQGGRVVMAAELARELIGAAVNQQGLIRAQGIDEAGGAIVLSASGGDIVQAGTLEVSAAGDNAAGTVTIRGDRDLTLAEGSRILATGASGGELRAVADGRLDYLAGASIDVARQSAAGEGGFAELSGYEGVRIRELVHLGEQGRLLIDPPTLTIGGANDDIPETLLESQLQTAGAGSQVQLAADSLITLRDLADGVLDGSNADPAYGGGLLLGIGAVDGQLFRGTDGSIVFEDQTDIVRVEGSLDLISGSVTGDIIGGGLEGSFINVQSAGALDLARAAVIASGDGSVNLSAGSGRLVAGDISGGFISLSNANGTVLAGNLVSTLGLVSVSSTNADAADDAGGGPVSGIELGGVQAFDGLSLTTSDLSGNGQGNGIVTGDIQSNGFTSIQAARGDVDLGSVSVAVSPNASQSIGDRASLFVEAATDARINTGDLRVVGGNGGGDLFINGGQLNIQGGIDVSGGGGTVTFFPELDSVASVTLQAAGDLLVSGLVQLTGIATEFAFSDSFSSFSQSYGAADLSISSAGGAVNLAGGMDLTGVGGASAEILAQSDVTIGGASRISATAGSQDSSFFNSDTGTTQSSSLRQGGGRLAIETAGRVETGNLSVNADSAAALVVRAGSIAVNGTAEVLAQQGPDATAPVDQRIDDGQTLLDSSFGLALLELDTGASVNGSILTNGAVTVVGPAAGAGFYSLGSVEIGGGLEVRGSGYTLEGDSKLIFLVNDFRTGFDPDLYPQLPLGPLFDTGRTRWGGAGLRIGSRDPEFGRIGTAGAVLIGGDLVMSGIGEVIAEIDAAGFSLAATTGGPGDISMQASAGELLGSRTDLEAIDGSLYEVTRSFDNGAGGAATYGHADLRVSSSGGAIGIGNLSQLGLSARASFENPGGGGVASLGDVSISGTDQAGLTRQRLVTSYADSPQDELTAPPLASTTTLIDGNLHGLKFGDSADPFASLSAGDIAISGVGFAGLVVAAGSTGTGLISVSAFAGEFSTDDLRTYGQALQSPLGDALVVLGVPGGPAAQIEGLSVSADNRFHLGLNIAASGAVDFQVGGALSQQLDDLPTDDPHPLDRYPFTFEPILTLTPAATTASVSPRALITLPDSVIQAQSIRLSLGATDSQLGGLNLSAADTLVISGGGGALSFGSDLNLIGASVQLDDLSVDLQGDLRITATATDPVEGPALAIRNVLLDLAVDGGGQLVLQSQNGALEILDSDFEAALATIDAAGDVSVSGSLLEGGLALQTGGALGILDSSLFALDVSPALTFEAAGAIDVERSQLVALSSLTMSAGSGGLQLRDSALEGPALARLAGADLLLMSNTSLLSSDAGLTSAGDLQLDAASIAAAFNASAPNTPAQTLNVSAGSGLSVNASGLSADRMSFSGASLLLTNLGLSAADRIDLAASASGPAGGAALELRNLSLEAGNAISVSASNGALLLDASSLNSESSVEISGLGLTLLNSSIDSVSTTLDSQAATSLDNSLLIGDLQLRSAGNLDIVNGTVMDGTEGSLQSDGRILISGVASGRDPVLRFGSLFNLVAGTDLVVESAALGPGQARAASGGNLFLAASNLLRLQDANLQGSALGLQADAIELDNAFVGGGPVRILLNDPLGDLSDGGVASFIDADSLLIKGARNILLGASSLSVGSGQTEAGTGDAVLLAQLAQRGIAPAATNPNAAFLASNTLSLGSLALSGDYLMLQADRFSFGEGGLQAPGDLVLQYLPGSSAALVSLENLRAQFGEVNYGVQEDFPGTASDGGVVVIGGSAFGGNIEVGRNGSVTPPAGTNLVLYTSGDVTEFQPTSRDSGQVIIVGNLIVQPVVDEEVVEEVAATQSEVTPPPPIEPPVFPEIPGEDELIEQHTAEAGVDRLCP